MTYLIRTFRGYCYASNIQQAEELAANMVQELAKEGWPEDNIWAKIMKVDSTDFKLVHLGNLSELVIRQVDKSTTIYSTRWIRS